MKIPLSPKAALIALIALAAIAVTITVSGSAPTEDPPASPSPFLQLPNGETFLIGPKTHLLDGQIDQVFVSIDGSHALVLHRTQSPTVYLESLTNTPIDPKAQRITIVNGQTGHHVNISLDLSQVKIHDASVLSNGAATLEVEYQEQSVYILVTAQGQTQILKPEQDGYSHLAAVALKPSNHTLVQLSTEDTTTLSLYSPQGQIVRQWQNSQETVGTLDPTYLSSNDSVRLYNEEESFLFNPLTGNTVPTTPGITSLDPLKKIEIRNETASKQDLAKIGIYNRLNSHSEPSLIGVNTGIVSAEEALIAYLYDSAGLYRIELIPVDPKVVETWQKEKVKAETTTRAKQVATGLMIYCADYDDLLPLNHNWEESLAPYLSNPEITKGFNFLLAGQNPFLIDITTLGIIVTPYGEAIVHTDLTITWRDRP